MSGGWAAKRFWTAAEAVPVVEGGFAVRLDARPVKTPAKAPFVVPTLALAQAAAAEWDAQTGAVQPQTMPVTRAINAAIDKVGPLFDAVVAEVAGYGATDLLCYRAAGPEALVARLSAGWDPLIDWADKTLGARLAVTEGVMAIPQDQTALQALRAHVAALGPFHLTALHELVAISGSLILGLAVTRHRLTAADAWALCRIDEDWQAEQWGVDDDAAELAEIRRSAFLQAERFYALCGEQF
ncbi:MAG: ATPase [Rhodobacteraceae bacterium]|jgi:chaperone required for assembly of F1-ATPase|nr:ATPase [Paracoccaceae bacterium]